MGFFLTQESVQFSDATPEIGCDSLSPTLPVFSSASTSLSGFYAQQDNLQFSASSPELAFTTPHYLPVFDDSGASGISGFYSTQENTEFSDADANDGAVILAPTLPIFNFENTFSQTRFTFSYAHQPDRPFNDWLIDTDGFIVLFELNGHNGTQEETFYFSTGGYVSRPDDIPSNTHYRPLIKSIPDINLEIDSQSFNTGEINLFNGDGELDAIMLSHDFALRDYKVLIGAVGDAKNNFNPLMGGVSSDEGFKQSSKELSIGFHDFSKHLDVPLNANTITYSTDGEDEETNTPVCYGECFNITPVYIGKDDQARPVYKFNDTESEALVALYDKASLLTENTHYSVDLLSSEITIIVPTAGELTAHVKGTKRNDIYLVNTAQIIQDIITERTELDASYLELDSFAYMGIEAPYLMSFYADDGGNVFDAIRVLLDSIGGYLAPQRSGRLKIGRLGDIDTNTEIRITPSDITKEKLEITAIGRPLKSILLGYQKNYTPQKDVAGSLDDEPERKEKHRKEWSTVKVENTDPIFLAKYKGAEEFGADEDEENITETAIYSRLDAIAEANRRILLYAEPYRDFEFEGDQIVYQLNVGDSLILEHPRYGLSNGKYAQEHRINITPLKQTATATVRVYGL